MPELRILLHSGEYFYFDRPEECSFKIEDIAHALSNICRYGGHCPEFYSVAQHSILVAEQVAPKYQLTALLHDATEAFIGDMVKPLKEYLPFYKEYEQKLEALISAKHGCMYPLPPQVKYADIQLLVTEQRELMGNSDPWFGADAEALDIRIRPVHPTMAEYAFLQFYDLYRGN